MFEVYCIKNKINGKVYIGLTIQGVRTRFLHHLYEARSGSSFPIHRSINKHGQDNFDVQTVEVCETKELLKEREIYWISFYESTDREKGYNRTSGGDGTFDRQHSKETKEKIRQKALGRKASLETRQRMSNSRKGKSISENTLLAVKRRNELSKIAVLQYDIDMNLIDEFDSISSAAEANGINYRTIAYRLKHPAKITDTNRYSVKYIWGKK